MVGLEWGALIAAAYSQKGKVNDLEWQMSKLKLEHFTDPGLLVRSKIAPIPSKSMQAFFNNVFHDTRAENSFIKWSCPTKLLINGKNRFWSYGPISQILEKCLSFPPFFTANQGWVADAFQVSEAAKFLRAHGANVIVFVNVLAKGNFLKEDRVENETETRIIWSDGTTKLSSEEQGIDWVVGVHTRDYDILDFTAKQSFIAFGQESGAIGADKIANKYNF